MSYIDKNAETLSSFGLTVKQAKVYLALVFLGTAVVGEISKLSKVRREEVYRLIPKLEKMGLIEKTLSTPVKLKATSVENALSILIRNEEENAKNRIIELTTKKKQFIEQFRTSSKETKLDDGDQFSLTSEKAVSLGKINSLIDNAQSQVDCIASREKVLQFAKYFSESLNETLDRGVKFRVISNRHKEIDDLYSTFNRLFTQKNSISIRYLESLPNHFIVIDNKEVLIATSTLGYLADYPLLWSNNIPHVTVYKRLFDDLWDSSVEMVALNVNTEIERLQRFIKLLKPDQHVILLHETIDAKFKVFLNFINIGLDAGEAVVYICSESSVEEVGAVLEQSGLNVEAIQKSGALRIIDYTQHYLIDGSFDIDATAKLLKRYYDEATAKGFKGLRVCSEMACFFKHNLVKELVDYERSLHNNPLIPLTAIYAYRADQLMEPANTTNIYSEIVKAHGKVLFSWIDKELGRIAIS